MMKGYMRGMYGHWIYSHDTALYLLGYSDRTPAKYTITFPKGYNALSLKQEELIVKRVIPENYNFGIIKIESPPAIRFVFTIWNGRCVTYCAAAVAMFRLSEKL